MTPELRQQAARAFWLDEEATDDQVQAVLIIAQQKKFRPKFVLGLDTDRKARHLATLGSLPDAIAARVLIVYHLAEQRPMMGAFLDALGIKHEDGLIKDDDVKPDPEKLGAGRGADRAAVSGGARVALSEYAALSGPGDMGSVGRAAADRRRLSCLRVLLS